MAADDPLDRLNLNHYPRSLRYAPAWVVANRMGPHPIWLMEALTNVLNLEPGDRVLDLGAGTAITSIFLAKEFNVPVIAADLWVDPTENQRRVREAGAEDVVLPLRLEAHDLPFGDESFEAIVSVDAYHSPSSVLGSGLLELPQSLLVAPALGTLGTGEHRIRGHAA